MDSMTGYGSHSRDIREALISVQARSVNQKGLQIVFRLPQLLAGIEEAARNLIRSLFSRGRIEVAVLVSIQDASRGNLILDPDAVRSYQNAASALSSDFGVEGEVTSGMLLGLPGVMVQPSPEDVDRDEMEQTALECIGLALDSLADSRRTEGRKLSSLFRDKLLELSVSVDPLMEGQKARVREKYARLGERVELILGDTKVDSDRLMSELAIMADRIDITEEFERLKAHIDACLAILDEDKGECGRKLGFLFQEMLRELNTMGAKVDDTDAQARIISMKDVLGGMREQVANVE
jgi:uncharacterized protein (TIGR00255 family)